MFCATDVGVMTIGVKAGKKEEGWKDTDQIFPSGAMRVCFDSQ